MAGEGAGDQVQIAIRSGRRPAYPAVMFRAAADADALSVVW